MDQREILQYVSQQVDEIGEHEIGQAMDGTTATIKLLGEIAVRLANIEDQLSNLQFRAGSNALIVEVVS